MRSAPGVRELRVPVVPEPRGFLAAGYGAAGDRVGEGGLSARLRRSRLLRVVRQSPSGRMQLAGREGVRQKAVYVVCADADEARDADVTGLAAFAGAERAKRRLIAELFELKLPI